MNQSEEGVLAEDGSHSVVPASSLGWSQPTSSLSLYGAL